MSRLKENSPAFEKKGIQLSHIHPALQPLHLGRLQGNNFQLIIRDVRPHSAGSTAPPSAGSTSDLGALVQEAVDNVKARGFVNVYGPQRFGAAQSVQADQIGLALLKEEMVTAVRLFFTPDEGDDPQNRAKIHFLQTENAKESLALMPEHKVRERLVLRALHRYGAGQEGCARAWLSLPHGMRVFYIHAYCSRVWNQAAIFRLQRLGQGPGAAQGDLVWTREGQGEGTEQPPQRIHVVTPAEAADNVYSLQQVVLPMPGNSVTYPENEVGAWYQDRLKMDGLQTCRYRVTRLKLNIPGCYRPLVAYPRNLTHRLQGPPVQRKGDRCPLEAATGPSLALSFDLDASCYATVCLREIMKGDP
ncbi:hypothetical protein AAFF_G00260620 [Aldrovandia affinis]|uniref:TRUD domain-containing protein n=1 Tax=Aldrovandia affinis TaxID=143900 RepID=A0AAD7RC10_9TELE|nr:hypothetical protein AAFF_G00260620 [Aldrovandia affinis]